MNELSVNKALLFQYFASNASPVQKRLISEWLAQAENQELYFQWLAEWQVRSPQFLPQGGERYDQYLQYMRENPHKAPADDIGTPQSLAESGAGKVIVPRRIWLMAAASVLILAIAGWFGQEQILFENYQTAFGETRTVLLSDGTKVILNANSSLRVPRFGFGRQTREVKLNGEAFFTVTRTVDNKRFLVKTDENFEVVVLGTEFSVYTRQTGGKVLLKKGKVHVLFSEGKRKKELIMNPGDLVTLEKSEAAPLRKPNVDTQRLTAWTGNRFIFDKTPLSEVASQLQEHYGIKVEIQDVKSANRTVSGTFQPESGEELLTLLSELLDFKLTREGESYLILQK
jgi:transmembrane sensor